MTQTYAERVLQRVDELAQRYWARADVETRAEITNLTGLYADVLRFAAAQSVELDQWARKARDAEDARDEALSMLDGLGIRIGELEAELAAARGETNSVRNSFADAVGKGCTK